MDLRTWLHKQDKRHKEFCSEIGITRGYLSLLMSGKRQAGKSLKKLIHVMSNEKVTSIVDVKDV